MSASGGDIDACSVAPAYVIPSHNYVIKYFSHYALLCILLYLFKYFFAYISDGVCPDFTLFIL